MSFDHISTEEIKRDISDTLFEIQTMEREEKGFRMVGDRMSIFRADARASGIKDRHVFIEKLNNILKERGVV